MRIVETVSEARDCLAALRVDKSPRASRAVVGLIPTMGALHEGHVSLVRRCRAECDICVASIFVNPLQFGPRDDLAKYPRPFKTDCSILEGEGCDLVLHPSAGEMYPDGFQTNVGVARVSQGFCGAARPGHFDGVATVVLKLFNVVTPDKAYFGRKDYQQLKVIQRMAADLSLLVEIVPCPTLREADGLAMSSRNKYLSADERLQARAVSRSLDAMCNAFASGVTSSRSLIDAGMRTYAGYPDANVEYLDIAHADTLQPVGTATRDSIALTAARIGGTRLIDNVVLGDGIEYVD